jgi:hypothetical protein
VLAVICQPPPLVLLALQRKRLPLDDLVLPDVRFRTFGSRTDKEKSVSSAAFKEWNSSQDISSIHQEAL